MSDVYNDWQMHFEDCAKCKPSKPCPEGAKHIERCFPPLSADTKRNIDALDGAA